MYVAMRTNSAPALLLGCGLMGFSLYRRRFGWPLYLAAMAFITWVGMALQA